MVGHETVAMANPIVTLINMLEGVQKVFAVCIILEDRLLLVSTRSDMINSAGIFYTEGARHAATIAEGIANVKPQDLTLRGPFDCLYNRLSPLTPVHPYAQIEKLIQRRPVRVSLAPGDLRNVLVFF